jgi:hypothetical protein
MKPAPSLPRIAGQSGQPSGDEFNLRTKWQFRQRKLADPRHVLESKEARYKKLWEVRLSTQMAELPEFGEVFRVVRRVLREAGIISK